MDFITGALLTVVFLVAGVTKGVVGFGLPTVALGLGSLVIGPAQAAALLVVPSLVTNIWQGWVGPDRIGLGRRFCVFLAVLLIGTVAVSAFGLSLPEAGTGSVSFAAIGLVLILYGLMGVTAFQPRLPANSEAWSQPVFGAVTGLVTATTGLFAFPSAPYLQSLGLDRAALVQALGITFTTATVGLAIGLGLNGHLSLAGTAWSVVAVLPVAAGMAVGRWLGRRISQALFRSLFFIALIVLGARLALEGFAF